MEQHPAYTRQLCESLFTRDAAQHSGKICLLTRERTLVCRAGATASVWRVRGLRARGQQLLLPAAATRRDVRRRAADVCVRSWHVCV